jgi:hypothetical protein
MTRPAIPAALRSAVEYAAVVAIVALLVAGPGLLRVAAGADEGPAPAEAVAALSGIAF